MARLLGEARVAVLGMAAPRSQWEAEVKKGTAGISAKIPLELDTKKMDAQLAAEYAKVLASQSRIAKARQADEAAAARDIASRTKLYAGMFDQISKSEDAQARREAAISKAQQDSLARISKARQDDILSQQKGIQDTRNMYSRLFDDLDKRDKIKVGIDGTYTDEQMAGFRAKIALLTKKTNIRLGLNGGEAEAEALTLREKLALLLSDIKAKVHIDQNSTGGILSFISGKFSSDMASRFEKAGNNGGNGFISGLGKSAIFQNPGITAAVVAGMAALPAGVGAVGVLGGIALGAGLIYGAEKLVKAQIKNITADMKSIQTAMGGSPTSATTIASQKLAVQSTQATITRLESTKKLTAAQQSQLAIAKQRLVIEQQILSASQSKGQGTGAQQAQLALDQKQLAQWNKDVGAFSSLDNAVNNLKLTFTQFAIVVTRPLIQPFTTAVNDLSNELKGPLSTAFTGLFKAIAPLIPPVLSALLEIVEFALPGLTSMLNSARGPLIQLFAGFGRIVGLKIGDWFRAAAPYIQASSKYFLILVSALGSVITWLIKFGGESAKAFGGSQFKGFGSLISSIANSLLKIVIPAFEGWTAVIAPVAKELLQILDPLLKFLAANPGLVKAIAAIAAGMLLASKAMTILIGVTKLLGLSMDALPWVAVAAAAVLATVLIIQHWGQISAFFVKVWKAIWSGAIGPMINFFTETIPHAFGITFNWIKKNWPLLIGLIGGPFAEALVLIVKYHNQIFNVIKEAWGHVENVITGTLKPIASVIEGVWNQVYKYTHDIWNVIVNIIKIPILIIVGLVGEAWRGIKNLTGLVWPSVYNTVKDAWGHIENVTTGTVKPVVSVVVGQWDLLKKNTVATWNAVFDTVKTSWGHIENVTTGIVKPMVSWIEGAWNTLKNATKAAYDWLFNTIKAAWGHIENATTGIIKPMISWINGAWTTLKSGTSTAFKAIYNYIISPLQKAGTWVAHTFVSQIESAFRGLVSTVTAIWNGLRKAVATPINFVINDIWNPFAGFVNAGLSIFGIKQRLPKGTPVKFAKGGHVPGFAPGVDNVPALLSPGEFVLTPEAVKTFGVGNLHALNKNARTGDKNGGRGAFANGGDVVNDIEKWNGHKYIWGGGANPSTGWDCSSFVNYIVGHDFKLNLPGGGSWSQMTSNGAAHGPVAAAYNNWNYGRGVPWSGAKKGDLAIENNGAHIGFIIQDNTTGSSSETLQGFAARSTATGTGYEQFGPGAFHLERFADDRGFVSQVYDNTVGAVLKAAAGLALNGIEGLVNGALNHIPGGGPVPALAKVTIDDIIGAAKKKLTGNQNNYQFTQNAATGPAGQGTSAGELANGKQLYNYLKTNLFGGNKIAAAGAAASIWGESTWNPFAQGTGGRGLIGWTPPSTISNSDFSGGMRTQLPAILRFVTSSGDSATIAEMFRATSVLQAANEWGKGVERFGINDVHPEGVQLATSFMRNGGLIPGGVFDSGGTLMPGPNIAYNLTGAPERLNRQGGGSSGGVTTLEVVSGGESEFEQFMLTAIRRWVRVKGGQGTDSVQRAFGRR